MGCEPVRLAVARRKSGRRGHSESFREQAAALPIIGMNLNARRQHHHCFTQ